MKPIRTFTITPSLPSQLKRLYDIAYNMWWCWDHDAIQLFRRIDPQLWNDIQHNPTLLLGKVSQARFDQLAKDDGFLTHLNRVAKALDTYMQEKTWYHKNYANSDHLQIAYFSMEFGLHECIPIYSGGLGVLSGDHLKSASDLGLPLVGIGLFYQEGYFQQYLNADGWQGELYPDNDFYTLPTQLVLNEDQTPLKIQVEYPEETVTAQVWKIQVGRVPLYMLDTNIPENENSTYRSITYRLYSGNSETRIQQEILLGIGGLKALEAMNKRPTVCHINEGHAGFLGWERIHQLMREHQVSFSEAKEAAAPGLIFTTHTPVPAGIDIFNGGLIAKYLGGLRHEFGISQQEMMAAGRRNPQDENEPYNMAIQALRLAGTRNGVSKRHSEVSRRMWSDVWPGVPEDESPIIAITNGIHTLTWVSREMADLYDRYLGPRWRIDMASQELWARVDQIPREELWRTHERRRERLITFTRQRLKQQLIRRGTSPAEIEEAEEVLDSEALTIGFARRFATYKRATLLFHDVERLVRLLSDKDRPIQIIFSGKAHPQDIPGKELIRHIIHEATKDAFRYRIVFLENYDMTIARYLVQGVDVWLNTPRPPLEASGTSGMKVIANGGLNVSTLDGWWAEAYSPEVGWSIGRGESYEDVQYGDRMEADALYEILEEQVVPLFYDRPREGLPHKWIDMMKRSMKKLCPVFNTHRMVQEYAEKCYIPGMQKFQDFMADDMKSAKGLAAWRAKLLHEWQNIRILEVKDKETGSIAVGKQMMVMVKVELGQLNPDDVSVEIYHGAVSPDEEIMNGDAIAMIHDGQEHTVHTFKGDIPCTDTGLHGYAIRILPKHADLSSPFDLGVIHWSL